MNVRRVGLWTALAATAWLVLAGQPDRPAEVVEPIRLAKSAPSAPASAPTREQSEELLSIRPRAASELPERPAPRSMFGQKSWAPPPPPPPPPVAEKPTAPPLPFQFIGKHWDGSRWTVYLSRNDATLLVKAGDVLDDEYRVQSIDTSQLVMLYVPLRQEQALSLD